jgi:hypothetical protein
VIATGRVLRPYINVVKASHEGRELFATSSGCCSTTETIEEYKAGRAPQPESLVQLRRSASFEAWVRSKGRPCPLWLVFSLLKTVP